MISLSRTLLFLLAFGLTEQAVAQADYPSKPIKLIVPYAPGGPDDLVARILSKPLADILGQPVLVENHPGVGGTIAMSFTAKSAPDGYTLAVADTGQLAIAPGLYAKLQYTPLIDLIPVSNVALLPYTLAINAKVPANNVRELITLAKSRKDPMSCGSTGPGGSSNLGCILFASMAGLDILQVPYKGLAPSVMAVLTGEVDMTVSDLASVARHAKDGKLRLLASTSAKRAPAAPELPTVDEAGVKGYSLDIWIGVIAPAATPRAIVEKLNAAIVKATKTAEVQQRFRDIGYALVGDTPEQFGEKIRADIEKFGQIIKSANLPRQ